MKVLVLQHVASEHPGSFREVMKARGDTMHQIELDEGANIAPLSSYDVMLVMGGPMDVWETAKHPWLVDEIAAIRDWVGAGRPYLGICLGAQLLAVAMGGEVAPMTAPPEIGMSEVLLRPDPVFAGVPHPCTCFQWHGAEVTALPPGARQLATSDGCRVQGFGVGPAAYGLQFHLELTNTTAREWGALPEYAAALERVKGPGALPALQDDVARKLPALQDAARRIFGNFLNLSEAALRRETAV